VHLFLFKVFSMNGFSLLFSTLLLAGLLAGPSSAEVTWTNKNLDLEMSPGAMELRGAFTFTNDGEAYVTITSVKPSCGCTTTALEKKVYGPGESGVIAVVFSVGDRVGKQVKKIVVRTDDPATPVTTLTLRADIPQWVELKPRLLMWKSDEALDAKTVEVTFHDAEPVVLKEAVAEEGGLSLAVKELEAGRRYAVTVQPEMDAVTAEVRALVNLKLEGGDAEQNVFLAHQRREMLRFLVRVAERSEARANTNQWVVGVAAQESTGR